MTVKRVENVTKIALPLPGNITVPPGRSILVTDWEKKESSDTLRGWIAAKALVVTDVEETDEKQEHDPVISTGPAEIFLGEDELRSIQEEGTVASTDGGETADNRTSTVRRRPRKKR